MKRNRLGKTDMEVTLLSFGGIKLRTAQRAAGEALLHRCLDLGINYIDTTRSYGDSERSSAA